MEPRDYVHLLRRYWRSVVVVALLTLVATALVTFVPTPKYTATAQMFVSVRGGESVSDLANGSQFTEKQMSSYARVATSPLVLDPVIKDLGLRTTTTDFAKTVTATVPIDTVILEIAATSSSAQQSATIANAVAKQLSSAVADLDPLPKSNSRSVRATIFAAAQPPESPSSPNVPINLAVGCALALVLSVGLAVLRQVLNSKVRSAQDVHELSDAAILGVVPFDTAAAAHPVVMHNDSSGVRSEAIRRLRANLRFVDIADRSTSIVVSSSIMQEGKTTTAINLAIAMADAGVRVILVDADLRRPSIAHYLGLNSQVGLTSVLIGDARLRETIQPWDGTTLDVLPAGELPPNPSELVGSDAMASVIRELSSAYDMVIMDSPPLLPVSDALVLGNYADGTLLVVGVDRIRKPQLQDSLESLSTVGANVLGLVLNKIARGDTSSNIYDLSYPVDWKVGLSDSQRAARTAGPAKQKKVKARGARTAPTES